MALQSGLRETKADVVELGKMEGPVLVALISAMYGKATETPSAIALPLFLAADAYQVEAHGAPRSWHSCQTNVEVA